MVDGKKQIGITIPEELDELITSIAKKNYLTKTQWLMNAILEKMKSEKEQDQ